MSGDETETITLLRNRLARISELIDDFENLWMNVSNSDTSVKKMRTMLEDIKKILEE